MLGHELTHIRNGDVQMMVIAVIIAGVVGFFAELLFRGFFNFGGYGWGRAVWSSSSSSSSDSSEAAATERARRRRDLRHHHRGRADRTGVAAVATGAAGAVAIARIAGRRRFGRTDQESRRHDLGAAQDRRPRRIAGRDLGGDGNVPRQPARRLFRSVRDPPVGRKPGRGAGEICRRSRSRAAGAAGAPDEPADNRPLKPNKAAGSAAGAAGADGAAPTARRRASNGAQRRPLTLRGPWGNPAARGDAISGSGALLAVVNDIGSDYPERLSKELNSPLFLPCSRPKQA